MQKQNVTFQIHLSVKSRVHIFESAIYEAMTFCWHYLKAKIRQYPAKHSNYSLAICTLSN